MVQNALIHDALVLSGKKRSSGGQEVAAGGDLIRPIVANSSDQCSQLCSPSPDPRAKVAVRAEDIR
jgi:hypothetical protein